MTDDAVRRRNARNRAAGKEFERAIERHLIGLGFDADRTRDKGTKDEGDLVVRLKDGRHVIVQAKAEKSFDLSGYLRDVKEQRVNYIARHPFLEPHQVLYIAVVKAPRKSIAQCYVVTDVEGFAQFFEEGV